MSKFDILRAYRPGTEPSERTFRTLRERGVVSAGVSIRHHRNGRITGQLRCYAALNLDAVVLVRHDRSDEAARLAEEAGRFEREWQPLVAELAAQLDLKDFDAFRSARNRLVHDLGPATQALERLRDQLSIAVRVPVTEQFVRVSSVTKQWATLEVLSQQWSATLNQALTPLNDEIQRLLTNSLLSVEPAVARSIAQALEPLARESHRLAVDSFLPRAASLVPGDIALLRIEHSAGASVLSLLAAVQESERFELDPEFAPYFSDEPLPPEIAKRIEEQHTKGRIIAIPRRTVALAS